MSGLMIFALVISLCGAVNTAVGVWLIIDSRKILHKAMELHRDYDRGCTCKTQPQKTFSELLMPPGVRK